MIAAALPALLGAMTATMTWRSCTLPLLTQGRASDQNFVQYLQFASMKT